MQTESGMPSQTPSKICRRRGQRRRRKFAVPASIQAQKLHEQYRLNRKSELYRRAAEIRREGGGVQGKGGWRGGSRSLHRSRCIQGAGPSLYAVDIPIGAYYTVSGGVGEQEGVLEVRAAAGWTGTIFFNSRYYR